MDEKSIRSSKYISLITYLSEEQIQLVIQAHAALVYNWAYILHDKDLNEDGTPKVKHYHILLWLYNPKTKTSVEKWFRQCDSTINTMSRYVIDVESMVDYLLHTNETAKAHYEESQIVSKDWEEFKDFRDLPIAWLIIEDFIAGLPRSVMVTRYGRDFVINYTKYYEMAEIIKAERGNKS